jgi:hypothetical protein
MNSSTLKPGSLLKVNHHVVPELRFYRELKDDIQWDDIQWDDIQWDGKSKLYPNDILIYLGSEMVRFVLFAHVFSSSQGKTGYAALSYLSDLK